MNQGEEGPLRGWEGIKSDLEMVGGWLFVALIVLGLLFGAAALAVLADAGDDSNQGSGYSDRYEQMADEVDGYDSGGGAGGYPR